MQGASSWVVLCSIAAMAPAAGGAVPGPAVFACVEGNDLYRAATASGLACVRFATPADAVRAAPDGSGVLILADGYPAATTRIAAEVYEAAAAGSTTGARRRSTMRRTTRPGSGPRTCGSTTRRTTHRSWSGRARRSP